MLARRGSKDTLGRHKVPEHPSLPASTPPPTLGPTWRRISAAIQIAAPRDPGATPQTPPCEEKNAVFPSVVSWGPEAVHGQGPGVFRRPGHLEWASRCWPPSEQGGGATNRMGLLARALGDPGRLPVTSFPVSVPHAPGCGSFQTTLCPAKALFLQEVLLDDFSHMPFPNTTEQAHGVLPGSLLR